MLHFVGHGHHDPASLVFCDDTGRAELIRAEAVGSALVNNVELRLAVLNACHSARASERNAFGGVAQVLLERSMPAVVAMQFAVSDTVAIEFAGRFYAAVTHGSARRPGCRRRPPGTGRSHQRMGDARRAPAR